jgi:hypothetical protein
MPSRASIVRWPAAHDGRARRRRVRRGPPDAATPKRIGAAVVTSLRASAAFSARPSFTPFASSACTRSNGSSHQSLSSWTVVVIENLELVGEARRASAVTSPSRTDSASAVVVPETRSILPSRSTWVARQRPWTTVPSARVHGGTSGTGGIRTPGGANLGRFQGGCIRPLCHRSGPEVTGLHSGAPRRGARAAEWGALLRR